MYSTKKKSIQTLPSRQKQQFYLNKFKKKFSLNQKQTSKYIHLRQQLKNKYLQFIQTKRKYLDQCPCSPSSEKSISKLQLQNSMPSIRIIREQTSKIGKSLHRTISKYNYQKHEKQKKQQILNRKKQQYEKLLHLRQQNKKQKQYLNDSRIKQLKQDFNSRLKLKSTVILNKMSMTQSKSNIFNRKKYLGQQRRSQLYRNKFQISLNKSTLLQHNQNIHKSIYQQQYSLKNKKKYNLQQKLTNSSQKSLFKLNQQINHALKFQKKSNLTINQFSVKIHQLEKSNLILNEKLKIYDKMLRNRYLTNPKKPSFFKISIRPQNKRSKTQNCQDPLQ